MWRIGRMGQPSLNTSECVCVCVCANMSSSTVLRVSKCLFCVSSQYKPCVQVCTYCTHVPTLAYLCMYRQLIKSISR